MFCAPPAPGLYGMAPKLLLRIFKKRSKEADTSFHHAEAFGNKIRVTLAPFCVIHEVLELSESVRTLADRTRPFLTP
jgi:hypothetical protein